MSKSILITATELHLSQFWKPHIKNFIDNGYSVDIICSVVSDKLEILKTQLCDLPVSINVVNLSRSPLKISNLKGYKQMKTYLAQKHYDIIMTNEPVMGVVTRLAAKKHRKKGTKILYTAHGFHFYTGAPKKNWLLFYPIEKALSKITDALVTINTEDFVRAKSKFKAKNTYYIHGIGIDLSKFSCNEELRRQKRKDLGVADDEIMLLSVAELTKRKNLQVAIRAFAKSNNAKIKYFVRGVGELHDYFVDLIKELGVEDKVFLLGYGKDIPQMCCAADVFVFPTLQEGLPVALMESMACGLPVICSDIRGNEDLIDGVDDGFRYNCYDVDGFAEGINRLSSNEQLRKNLAENGLKKLDKFSIENVQAEYIEILNTL